MGFGALGVVYGDIGTSPLYAFRETLRPVVADGLLPDEIIGAASLLIWALITVVTLKYVAFLLYADNEGEGGVLALYARVRRTVPGVSLALMALGIAGAAFFLGDAVLTPAISVLSAIEGTELIEPGIAPYVLPMAIGVIAGLYAVQQKGTELISRLFAPVMAVWFLSLAAAGVHWLVQAPVLLQALSPLPGIRFMIEDRAVGLLVLSGVFLSVTGAEALYADLGHFGRAPIQLAWLCLVMPALILTYLGQAALVYLHPVAASDPFFLAVGAGLRPALVGLATLATIIASQATISGAYSLARQAIQLGLLPRFAIRHTSEDHHGQIFIPVLNAMMAVATIWIALGFGSSEALASAYGIAVLGTMLITTVLAAIYLIRVRKLHLLAAGVVVLPFVILESGFGIANSLKIADGGYVPLAIAILLMVVMAAWVRGTRLVAAKAAKTEVALDSFVASMQKSSVTRVHGTAFFLTSEGQQVPSALLHNIKHNRVLHETNVILTIKTLSVPEVPELDRVRVENVGPSFQRMQVKYGFMETPNLTSVMATARRQGLKYDLMGSSFFLGRRRVVQGPRMGVWRLMDRLYILLTRVSADPIDYFNLPRDRVVEIGSRMAV